MVKQCKVVVPGERGDGEVRLVAEDEARLPLPPPCEGRRGATGRPGRAVQLHLFPSRQHRGGRQNGGEAGRGGGPPHQPARHGVHQGRGGGRGGRGVDE